MLYLICTMIWAIGAVVGYLMMRRHSIKSFGKWTVSDRQFAILMSTLSWVNVFVAVVAMLVDSMDDEKHASW